MRATAMFSPSGAQSAKITSRSNSRGAPPPVIGTRISTPPPLVVETNPSFFSRAISPLLEIERRSTPVSPRLVAPGVSTWVRNSSPGLPSHAAL